MAPHTALRDVRMGGVRELAALAAQASSEAPTLVTVPFGTQPGRYHLLACADDRAAVAEAAEGDNCRVATHPEDGVEVPTPIQILAEGEYRVDAFSDIFDQPDEANDVADLRALRPDLLQQPGAGTSTLPAALVSVHAFLAEHAPTAKPCSPAPPPITTPPRAGGRRRRDRDGPSRRRAGRAGARARARADPGLAPRQRGRGRVQRRPALGGAGDARRRRAPRGPDRPRWASAATRSRSTTAGPRWRCRPARRGRPHAGRRLGRRAAAERGRHEPRGDDGLLAGGARGRVPRAGRHRQPQKPLDSSRGKATELRKLELPGVPKEAAQMRTFFQNQATKLQSETTAQIDRANQLEATSAPSATSGRARRTAATARRSAASTTPPRRPTSAPSTRPSTPSSTRSSSSSAASGATTSARTTSTRSCPTPRASGAPGARSRIASRSA